MKVSSVAELFVPRPRSVFTIYNAALPSSYSPFTVTVWSCFPFSGERLFNNGITSKLTLFESDPFESTVTLFTPLLRDPGIYSNLDLDNSVYKFKSNF